MMDSLTHSELRRLSETRSNCCVSIYMPAHRAGRETRQDPLRLRGLLDEAEQRLVDAGLRSGDARQCLKPARRRLEDSEYWKNQGDGLAMLMSPAGMNDYRLPYSFESLAVVGGRFYLMPLLTLHAPNADFYILAFSPKRVRLLYATRDAVDELHVDGLPGTFDEAVGRYLDLEQSLQFHTRAAPIGKGTQDRAAVFHGHGVGADDAQRKVRLLEFCQAINNKLEHTLAESSTPLVLAADKSLLPIFRDASHYPHTLDDSVAGNPDDLSAKQLRDAAWPIVQERQRQRQKQTLEEFGNASGRGKSSTDLSQILVAVAEGRVGSLVFAAGHHCWGTFDPAAQKVELHDKRQTGDEDLLNTAAVDAYLSGAELLSIHPDDMPSRSPLAAIFRY